MNSSLAGTDGCKGVRVREQTVGDNSSVAIWLVSWFREEGGFHLLNCACPKQC